MGAELRGLKLNKGSLTVEEMVFGLRRSCAEPAVAPAYRPDNLGLAIEVQACELISAWRAGLSDAALGARLSSLVCDLVYFGDSLGLDLEAGLRMTLERQLPPACPIEISRPISSVVQERRLSA